jgi:hypothetical protein
MSPLVMTGPRMANRDKAVSSGDAAVSIAGDSYGSVSTNIIDKLVFDISSVPIAIAAKDPRPVFTAVDIDSFTGRNWLADEVDQFIDENPCGYLFIESEAGLGKTAFAAWLVKTRGYLSHFSHYSSRGSVRAALQNLSAQLISNFDLSDQAPGAILPKWSLTPEGFESLLNIAAERRYKKGRPLVLVVDGMDEADELGDGMPFGLPSLLPDGVYVIGMHRPGRSPVSIHGVP